jgi:hypothetical protein
MSHTMGKNSTLTKFLAIAGMVLAWLPVLTPVLLSLAVLIRAHRFLFDYLGPAELFPLVLVGGGLLLWAAIRARLRRRLIAWAFGITAVSLFGSQALAVATGLASGETEPTGWPWVLVLALIVAYDVAVVAIGVGGALLVRDLFGRPRSTSEGI